MALSWRLPTSDLNDQTSFFKKKKGGGGDSRWAVNCSKTSSSLSLICFPFGLLPPHATVIPIWIRCAKLPGSKCYTTKTAEEVLANFPPEVTFAWRILTPRKLLPIQQPTNLLHHTTTLSFDCSYFYIFSLSHTHTTHRVANCAASIKKTSALLNNMLFLSLPCPRHGILSSPIIW